MKLIPLFGFFLLSITVPAYSNPEDDVESFNEQFYDAWRSRDVDKLTGLYTEDAEVFWPYKEEEAHGRQEFQDLLKWEFSFPSVEVEVEQLSQKIYEFADGNLLVLDISNQTFAGPDGKPMTVKIRSLALYKRVNGGLQIAVEHSSIAQPWEG